MPSKQTKEKVEKRSQKGTLFLIEECKLLSLKKIDTHKQTVIQKMELANLAFTFESKTIDLK